MYNNDQIPRIDPNEHIDRQCPECRDVFVTTYRGICSHHASCYRKSAYGSPPLRPADVILALQQGPCRHWDSDNGLLSRLGYSRSPWTYQRTAPILRVLRQLGVVELNGVLWSLSWTTTGREEALQRADRHLQLSADALCIYEASGDESALLEAEAHEAMATVLIGGCTTDQSKETEE